MGAERTLPVAPLQIGGLTIDPPVVLAPMAGVTNPPFRVLCLGAGDGLYVSEMITARALVEGNARTRHMVTFAPQETRRSVQLYGTDPTTMARAVRILCDEIGVDHIDMNFGCPVPKVTRKGGGAALPLHPVLFGNIVAAAVEAAAIDHVPVTAKFRMGTDADHVVHLETGRIAVEAGAAAVALHARTAEQRYSGKADWTAIAALKDHLAHTGVPVLGNGDIWDATDALAMLAETGCDGVVVGRGCLGRPWLFRELAEVLAGRPAPVPPTLGEVFPVLYRHAELLTEWHGDETAGLRAFRKHAGWYLLGYPVGSERRRQIGLVSSMAELRAITDQLDPTLALPDGHVPRPRGKSDGPRPVALPDGWLDHPDDPTPPAGAELLVSGG